MIGEKERPYVEELERLAARLGYEALENQRYAEGHYQPDLIGKKDGRTVGFEVEFSDVDGKKIIGDAFWLWRTFDMGIIEVVRANRVGRFKTLIAYLGDDFNNKVWVVSAAEVEEEVAAALRQ
jgi:hypothetical protein